MYMSNQSISATCGLISVRSKKLQCRKLTKQLMAYEAERRASPPEEAATASFLQAQVTEGRGRNPFLCTAGTG